MATNLEQILAFLRGKGLTPAQAAGVAGNLTVESGLDPIAYNSGEHALGIAQWEKGRLTNLGQYAINTHQRPQDLSTQLGFMWSELQGSESGAYRALLTTTTPAQAAAVWDQQYERSDGKSRAKRIADAQAIAAGGDPSKSGFQKAVDSLLTGGLSNLPGAGQAAANKAADTVTGLFQNWQTDALGLGMKLAGAAIAGTLVVVGAKQALTDKGAT